MKNKILIISFILCLGSIIFSIHALYKDKIYHKKSSENQIVLFYGENCPHCLEVDKYIYKNKISEKIKFEHKEVYNNQKNSQELSEKAKICGLNSDSIGIPFLFAEQKCYMGDKDVINFFEEKINK